MDTSDATVMTPAATVVTRICAGAPSPLAGAARVMTSPAAWAVPPLAIATAVAQKNWSTATLNLTGGPFQKLGAPPVTAVVIGIAPLKPVANCGTIQHARRQSEGYWYSYAQGGAGMPFCQVRRLELAFSGVPGAEVMKVR